MKKTTKKFTISDTQKAIKLLQSTPVGGKILIHPLYLYKIKQYNIAKRLGISLPALLKKTKEGKLKHQAFCDHFKHVGRYRCTITGCGRCNCEPYLVKK